MINPSYPGHDAPATSLIRFPIPVSDLQPGANGQWLETVGGAVVWSNLGLEDLPRASAKISGSSGTVIPTATVTVPQLATNQWESPTYIIADAFPPSGLMVTRSGIFLITAGVLWQSSAAPVGRRQMQFLTNGVATNGELVATPAVADANASTGQGLALIKSMVNGDTITMQLFHTQGVNLVALNDTRTFIAGQFLSL
jgi:hypothetical protein